MIIGVYDVHTTMIRYQIHLRQEQLANLKALAKSEKTVSEQIRVAIDKYLEEAKKLLVSKSPTK